MKTLTKQGRVIAVDIDRRDVACGLNRYFCDPLFRRCLSAAMHAGPAC